MKNVMRSVLVAMVVGFLAACSSTPVENKNPPPVTDNSSGATKSTSSGGVANVVAPARDELATGLLAKRSIYFDFDSYVVKDEFRPVVEAHAKYLLSNKTRKLVIQGNADERGTSEYNLALGQKRAEAVRRAFGLLGVPESQVEAVSFGKEKPKATGHDEAAWAENRRADVVYQ